MDKKEKRDGGRKMEQKFTAVSLVDGKTYYTKTSLNTIRYQLLNKENIEDSFYSTLFLWDRDTPNKMIINSKYVVSIGEVYEEGE